MYQIRKQSAAYSEGYANSKAGNPYAPCTIAHADYEAGKAERKACYEWWEKINANKAPQLGLLNA